MLQKYKISILSTNVSCVFLVNKINEFVPLTSYCYIAYFLIVNTLNVSR